MIETINRILTQIHQLLFPARGLVTVVGIVYLSAVGLYYSWARNRKEDESLVTKVLIHSGLAGFVMSYGVILEYQEPYVLQNLYLLVPLCSLLPSLVLVLFLGLGFYFTSTAQKEK